LTVSKGCEMSLTFLDCQSFANSSAVLSKTRYMEYFYDRMLFKTDIAYLYGLAYSKRIPNAETSSKLVKLISFNTIQALLLLAVGLNIDYNKC